MITPVVEVDGRDRQVDIYNWHLAHPKDNWPPLVYWGKYLVHDNNRDAMGATLNLTRNVHRRLRRPEGAAAARPARVGAVPLRQHRRRRPVQRVGRSDPRRRVAAARLEQHVRDDQVRHARRLRPRHVRHLVARLPDVHRARCTTASAACTRRSATAAPTRWSGRSRRATTRAPGTSRTRRCRRRCGRSATTTTTSRPGC